MNKAAYSGFETQRTGHQKSRNMSSKILIRKGSWIYLSLCTSHFPIEGDSESNVVLVHGAVVLGEVDISWVEIFSSYQDKSRDARSGVIIKDFIQIQSYFARHGDYEKKFF